MPHDRDGKVLSIGDYVYVPCVVTMIATVEEHCNVTLETVEPMYPGDYKTTITLNSKQVEKK
jgi:hypothetical protein